MIPGSNVRELRRVTLESKTQDPAWWTAEKLEAMEVLFRRSELTVRMGHHKGPHKETARWRPFTGARTKGLHEYSDVLTPKTTSPAIKGLLDWGYIIKGATAVPRVYFTTKGWAWLAANGKFDPAWLEVIFDKQPDDLKLAWDLYRRIKQNAKLRALATSFTAGLEAQAVADIMEPSNIMADLPFNPDADKPLDDNPQPPVEQSEIPGLPQFDDPTEWSIVNGVRDADLVQRRTLQLARDFHFKTGPSLNGVEPQKVAEAIGKHFTPDEVLRADHEIMQRGEDGGLRETYYSRELLRRMSEAGEFRAPTLADHLELNPGHGARGVSRIALALETQELADEGLARHMPPQTTLGEVYDRIDAEKAAGLHGISNMPSDDAVEASPENIAAASAAAKAEDDALPMVDWIDRQIEQYAYDGWVPEKQVGLIARGAVLRHMRENPVGAQVVMSHGDMMEQYDGHRLHLRSRLAIDGRDSILTMTVESDYDEDDVQKIKSDFSAFIDRALDHNERRTYQYPVGSKVDHERVGEIELVKVSPAFHPVTSFAMAVIGGLVALGGLMLALSFIPNVN